MSVNGDSALRALAGEKTFDPVATPRVADVIAERLAHAIREGVLQPGDRLPTEHELAREFGVGRTSVREGLQKLKAYGLVESRKGLGAFVTEPSDADPLADFARWAARDPAAIEKLIESRIALETVAASLAALRATDEAKAHLERLYEDHEAADKAHDVAALVRSDESFHQAIFAAANNEIISSFYDLLITELTDFRRKTLALPWAASRSTTGHRAILDAIQAGDAVAAREAMGEHLWALYTEVHDSVAVGDEGVPGLRLAPREALF